MSSTLHYEQHASQRNSGRRFSGFSTSVIAAGTLVAGIVLGSTGWLDEGRYPAAALNETNRSIAAPAGARVYDDWRGNSAGINSSRRAETQ